MKSEITWSLMHPTQLDVEYMRRVVEKSKSYDMDSFELCGAFASVLGGINGLATLDPYPTAAKLRDREAILGQQERLRQIVALAHSVGKELYLWHREIMMPKGMLDDVPEMLDSRGEFDLLGKGFQDFLKYKIANAFEVVPELDGVVLTLTEADYSVIHNSCPDIYPPDQVVEEIVSIFAEEHLKRGKRFILRSFGSIASDYEDILRGARKAAEKYHFDIETKITPYDFSPFLPTNPFLKKQPNTTLSAECDCLGEFLGAGYLPSANVENIERYIKEGKNAGVSRYAIRLDRIGNSIFDCHEVNLYAYHRMIRDDNANSQIVYQEYAAKHWQNCQSEMIDLAKRGLEAVKKCNFIAGNVTFHKFPIQPDFKWVAAGGIFSVFPNNVSLKQMRGCWGILSDHNSPGRVNIRAEKREALALAEKGLADLQKLKGRLSDEEFRKAERVWQILLVAVKAIKAFVDVLASYFDDLDADRETPTELLGAISDAEKIIIPMMKNQASQGWAGDCCDGASLPGDDLDRVYLQGLLFMSRDALNYYHAEFKLRRELRNSSIDSVIAGGFGDHYRIFRYMHASHAEIKAGVPVRYAGNSVFPNGFIEVELNTKNASAIEIKLLPGEADEAKITVDGASSICRADKCGVITLPSTGKDKTTLRIEKTGKFYPPVVYIRSIK